MPTITVSAICFLREDGRVLTVRKMDTSAWMLPGGKPEVGESALDCAMREVKEELGISLDPSDCTLMGTWEAPAANEEETSVKATVFLVSRRVEGSPQAEIAEARWTSAEHGINDPDEAPLNREHIFPLLLSEWSGQRAARTARAVNRSPMS